MYPAGTIPAKDSREPDLSTRDRRRRMRQKVHTPAYASVNGSSAGMVLDLSEILDISAEGMSIQTSSPLEVNRKVNLCLDLSETRVYIHTTGQVVWSDRLGRAGVYFAATPDARLRRLEEWLFVNAIAGYVKYAAQTPQLEAEVLKERPRETAAPDLPQVEHQVAPPAPPGYTSIWTALTAVKREVESIGPDLNVSLQLIAEQALAFTRATGAAIALSQGGEMVCLASAGSNAPGRGIRLQAGSGFSGECVRSGRLLRCEDSETDPSVDRESCRALGVRSMVAVPIRADDAVIGLLEVFSPKPNAFSASDNTILQRLVEIILVAQASAGSLGIPGAGTPAEPAAGKSFGSRFRSTLLFAAPVTLLSVLLWMLVPWIKSWTSPSRQPGSRPGPRLQVPVAKTRAPVVANANDLESLRRLARQGDSAAQFALGARYATGDEVKQDYSEALRWFSMAAEQGHVGAQATLGAYYWAGRGVPTDLSKAYFWSILAQAGGDAGSKYRIAVLTPRMSRAQIMDAQQQADDWLKQHRPGSKSPSDTQ
jgi:hypothetical protein